MEPAPDRPWEPYGPFAETFERDDPVRRRADAARAHVPDQQWLRGLRVDRDVVGIAARSRRESQPPDAPSRDDFGADQLDGLVAERPLVALEEGAEAGVDRGRLRVVRAETVDRAVARLQRLEDRDAVHGVDLA